MTDEPILFASTTLNRPKGALVWRFRVSDQLVEAAQEWSGPVQFKFEKLQDGCVELLVRDYEAVRRELV